MRSNKTNSQKLNGADDELHLVLADAWACEEVNSGR